MINEKDVEILLANLSSGTKRVGVMGTGTETEFANLLFNFVQAGLIDKDRFRDIIIGARALAFDDGLDAAQEFAAQANQARRIQKARA